jgi:hypothetical protein
VDADIRVHKAVLADADILVEAATLVAAVTLADKPILAPAAILADKRIPAATATLAGKATLADEPIPVDEVIPAVAATRVNEAITVGANMSANGAGATMTGIVAVVASASGTTAHLTRMVPAITNRTIAIPTATTINGAIGIPQPLAVTPTRTGINVSLTKGDHGELAIASRPPFEQT